MFLILVGILLCGWMLFSGWKFYRTIDWDEPADPSPDLRGMHKQQAQLQHIQEVLEEACSQGKLSKSVVEEFNRYSEAEIEAMRQVEAAWKQRRKK